MSPGNRPSPGRVSHGHSTPAATSAIPTTISSLRMSIALSACNHILYNNGRIRKGVCGGC